VPLSGIHEGSVVGFDPVQGTGYPGAIECVDRGGLGCRDEAFFGVEDEPGGVAAGAVLGEHRLAIAAPQRAGFDDRCGGFNADRMPR